MAQSMGQEQTVKARQSLSAVVQALAGRCVVVMVDGNLVMPTAAVPEAWNEVRLKTPAGMVTVRRRGDEVALVVFGNATAELLEARAHIAAAFAAS
jgi:hypothetical protein